MRTSCLSLLILLVASTSVGAAEIRDAKGLLRASKIASQFESLTLRQTRSIIRTYTNIVEESVAVELPQWIKLEIAACYEKAFAWEKFETGIAQIFLDNFSSQEIALLTDFYQSEGLPPAEIGNFKTAIAKGAIIQKLTADYIAANSEDCTGRDIELILGYVANPLLTSEDFHPQ